jgi:hypothetical protein
VLTAPRIDFVIVAWLLAGFGEVDFAIVIVASIAVAPPFGNYVQSYFVAGWKYRWTWIVAREVVESYSVSWEHLVIGIVAREVVESYSVLREDLVIGIVGRGFVAVAQPENGSLLGRDDWNLAVPRVVLLLVIRDPRVFFLLVIRDPYCAFVSYVYYVRCDSFHYSWNYYFVPSYALHVHCDSFHY